MEKKSTTIKQHDSLDLGNAKFGVQANLNSLLKTHGSSLSDEPLQTLLVEFAK